MKIRYGFLFFLLVWAISGVVLFNFMGTDPKGYGGGTRFAFIGFLGLLFVRITNSIARLFYGGRSEPCGFPVETKPPDSEA
jgi:hypothetical protein